MLWAGCLDVALLWIRRDKGRFGIGSVWDCQCETLFMSMQGVTMRYSWLAGCCLKSEQPNRNKSNTNQVDRNSAKHTGINPTSPNPAHDELHTHNPCSHHQNQQPMMSTQSPNTAAGRRTPNTSRITPSQPHRQHRAPRYKHTENSISNNCTNN